MTIIGFGQEAGDRDYETHRQSSDLLRRRDLASSRLNLHSRQPGEQTLVKNKLQAGDITASLPSYAKCGPAQPADLTRTT